MNEAIELLIKSFTNGFEPAILLLCIALIKKYGTNMQYLILKLKKIIDPASRLHLLIFQLIQKQKLNNISIFKEKYNHLSKIDYLYDFNSKPIISKELLKNQVFQSKSSYIKNISFEFYEGFGFDI